MHSGWSCWLLSLLLLVAPLHGAEKKRPGKGAATSGEAHMKEELGVNKYTTPGIDLLLQALRELRPLSYDALARKLPAGTPADRGQLALSTGAVIAEGFLAVIAEKQSELEPIGRALLRHAKGLGVGDYVTRHTRSILEQASAKNWPGVQAELIGAQRDVEKGMMALKDEEIAHLVALGGWWRGLEITATIIASSHTPERAALMVQPDVLDYFLDRANTLNPSLKRKPLFITLESNLRDLRKLVVKDDRSAPTADEVRKVRDLAKAMNDAVNTPSE